MEIEIEYVSMLDIDVENGSKLVLEDNITVEELLESFGLNKTMRRFIKPFINGEEKRHNSELHDGDRLFLFIPAGGG